MPQPTYYEHLDANLLSRIRGLVLGLALGDAVGSKASDIPTEGMLEAGAASQLAAWTIEGTLRNITRYGRLHAGLSESGLYAYQRWATLRGLKPASDVQWHAFWYSELPENRGKCRGWLADYPAMSLQRGSSPSTEKAVALGRARQSAGCQALLRILPVAAMAHVSHDGWGGRADPDQARSEAEDWARNLALLTHDDGERQNASALAVRVLWESLGADRELRFAVEKALDDAPFTKSDVTGALISAIEQPCVPQVLERLAPDKTSWSALAGGLYVALSFPDEDTITEAIEFAGWAPDGDSVAAVAGAILGARHGYEALPSNWVHRLELGWVMDRLATDLAAEVNEHQGGQAWKADSFDVPARILDPWWDTKYPGV